MIRHLRRATLTAVVACALACWPATPIAQAQSPCADLGGTIKTADHICHVDTETPKYTLSFVFPADYPDQQAIVGYLKQRRDQFTSFIADQPTRPGFPYALDVTATAYRSGSPQSGTESVALQIYSEVGGAHPVTDYQAFNYDLAKRAPITFDTAFKPGALNVIAPAVSAEISTRFGSDAVTNIYGGDDPKTYQDFAITDDSVIFLFGQGQILAEVYGPFEISVPRGQLAAVSTLSGAGGGPPACASGQVQVTADPPQAAVGHRSVPLTFTLAPGAASCTLTGYPGVDTGAGSPVLHADRTPSGYMGGLPSGVTTPPTVTLTPSSPAHAIVEGLGSDANGNACPTYTALQVTAPDTTNTITVPTTIDTCELQVHPVTA